MIQPTLITKALTALLNAEMTIDAQIHRDAYVNQNPDITPWVGIYRGTQGVEPRSMGGLGCARWEQGVALTIIAQQSMQGDSDGLSSERLDELVDDIFAAIGTDLSIGGTVDIVTGFDVVYSFQEDDSASLLFQNATITVTAEVKTA